MEEDTRTHHNNGDEDPEAVAAPNNDLTVEAAIDRVIDTSAITLDLTDDGSVTYIDVGRLTNVAQDVLTFAVQSSPGKQFGIGFGVGWLSGYMFKRVSKAAAIIVGCGFILLQGASSLGIVTINWQQMRFMALTNMRRVQRRINYSPSSPDNEQSLLDRIIDLSHQHVYLCSGFTTGAVTAITF